MKNDEIYPITEWNGYDLYFDPDFILEYDSICNGKISHERSVKIFVDMENQFEFPPVFILLKECIDIDEIYRLIAQYNITNVELAFVRIPSNIDKSRLIINIDSTSTIDPEDWWKYD